MQSPSHSLSEYDIQGGIHTLDAGSFSDEAARRVACMHGGSSVQNVGTIGKVWSAIQQGGTGLIPFENANAGVVWPHLNELRKGPYRIVGEVHQEVCMCVGARGGVTAASAHQVCSHHKALEQSSAWLKCHPHLQVNDKFDSTVDAARFVAEHQEILAVALGSRTALNMLKLDVLETDVADTPAAENITRMFLVRNNGHERFPMSDRQHHAAILRLPNYPGSLRDMLGIIAQAADLSSIHSRNRAHMQYEFFCQMLRTNDRFANMVHALHALVGQENVRWLGSWDYCLNATE